MSITLYIHILAGTIAVSSGVTALCTKKGGKVHRKAGVVFLLSMLFMTLTGTVIAFIKPVMISVLAGIFTAYLVLSSWMTIKTPSHTLTRFDYGSPILALFIGIAGIGFGMEATNSPSGLKDGFAAENYFFFGGLAFLATALDSRMLFYRGIAGANRIARHLWRMCLALYIAISSLAFQGTKTLPQQIQDSYALSIPENIVVLLMFFWLARVYIKKTELQENKTAM